MNVHNGKRGKVHTKENLSRNGIVQTGRTLLIIVSLMVCEAVCERDKLLRKEFEYFLISSAYVSKIPDKIPFSMLFF